jgi:hypothetical protein
MSAHCSGALLHALSLQTAGHHIGPSAAVKLFAEWPVLPNLRAFYFAENKLGGTLESCEALSQMLKRMPNLTELDLRSKFS